MPVNTIMGLFAKSPIKPLQRHVVCVNECCSHLVKFFEVSSKGDWEKASEIRAQISHLEKEADVLKREIRLKLPRGLFMPVDRTDMLELLTNLQTWQKTLLAVYMVVNLSFLRLSNQTSSLTFNVVLMRPIRRKR
mgnify:CR=1 FL=1